MNIQREFGLIGSAFSFLVVVNSFLKSGLSLDFTIYFIIFFGLIVSTFVSKSLQVLMFFMAGIVTIFFGQNLYMGILFLQFPPIAAAVHGFFQKRPLIKFIFWIVGYLFVFLLISSRFEVSIVYLGLSLCFYSLIFSVARHYSKIEREKIEREKKELEARNKALVRDKIALTESGMTILKIYRSADNDGRVAER